MDETKAPVMTGMVSVRDAWPCDGQRVGVFATEDNGTSYFTWAEILCRERNLWGDIIVKAGRRLGKVLPGDVTHWASQDSRREDRCSDRRARV